MGLLDWFKNRPAQFDPERDSDELTRAAIDKAVALVNPRLKLVSDYRERLGAAVETSAKYLRDRVAALPPAIVIDADRWGGDFQLRAFFAAAADIPAVLARSRDLRVLFNKYPALADGYFVLAMDLSEQQGVGLCLRGDLIARDRAQTTISFSQHRVRICGGDEGEVRRLIGAQGYEYLLAQALAMIGEERSERRELEDNRALLRARLRLLQQQGPGLGSLFAGAPVAPEAVKLEADLVANERAIEALNGDSSTLESELEMLREVLAAPQRYLGVEHRRVRLSSMNVVVEGDADEVAAVVDFSIAELTGLPPSRTAFVLARLARGELPAGGINFTEAARSL